MFPKVHNFYEKISTTFLCVYMQCVPKSESTSLKKEVPLKPKAPSRQT
jgi:hypothetical protein